MLQEFTWPTAGKITKEKATQACKAVIEASAAAKACQHLIVMETAFSLDSCIEDIQVSFWFFHLLCVNNIHAHSHAQNHTSFPSPTHIRVILNKYIIAQLFCDII